MQIFIKSSCLSLFLFLLCACNLPTPELSAIPETAPIPATDTPAQDGNNTDCGYAWAREPLPDLSKEFDTALKAVYPQASGYAEAYGENCLNTQGEVVRFLAMETDYYITLKVENLEDKQTLGETIAKIIRVLAGFPVGQTPGPQPGYVGITFEESADELRLWFTRSDAEAALENGLRGEELFNDLQSK